MPQLPPPVWADLWHDDAWNDVTEDVRVRTAPITMTRGLSSESSTGADPTSCTCDLDSRDDRYSPRNPMSPLYGKIGRNTPFRWGYIVGSPWAQIQQVGNINYASLFVNPTPALDVTGDFDLRVEISSDWWAAKQTVAQRAVESTTSLDWTLQLLDSHLSFMWFPAGTWESRIYHQSTVPLQAYTGQRLALRVTLDVDNGTGGHTVRFYTGRTVDDEDWQVLGEPLTGAGTTSLYTGNAYMELGGGFEYDWDPGTSAVYPLRGRAYALQLRAGIGGTPQVDMKTSQAEPGGSTFVDATGVTWHRGGEAVLTNRHIRMTGEVPAWPPTRDLSGNDNVVSIAPTGITRRMSAGNKPQESALLRYIRGRGPIECWPLTDGVDAKTARSMLGGRDMLNGPGQVKAPPTWAGGSLADWVEPVIAVKPDIYGGLVGYTPRLSSVGAKLHADVYLTGAALDGPWHFRIWDTGAGTNASPQRGIIVIMGGDLNQATLISHEEMTDSSSEAHIGNFGNLGIFDDQPHHLRLTVDLASPFVWLYVDGVEKAAGGLSINMRPLSRIEVGWGESSAERAAGFVTYWGEDAPSAAEMYSALLGFQGEAAGARIERLASEAGYTASVGGEAALQQPMGIQEQARLLELLNEANQTDFGYLLDARDRLEVIQRGGSTLWNQPPALTLDYSSGVIAAPFRPVDDDKLTENDVSVKRAYGSVAAQHVLEEGELSVQDPPNGVGRYDNEYTYSVATDHQADSVASMRLHLGTYNGVRYTRLTLNLANPRVFAMIDDILRIDVGDKIRLTNLPADHGPDAVDVLVHGYEEEAGPDAWRITFNCRPAEPWTTGVADGPGSRADIGGSQLAADIDADDTLVPLAVTGERAWTSDPADMPFDVRVGGEVMRVTACTPLILDTFDRTVASGWGTSDSGLAWSTSGGSTTDYSVSSGVGRHSMSTRNVFRITSLTGLSLADVDVQTTVSLPALPTGDGVYVYFLARANITAGTYYFARLYFGLDGTIGLNLRKRTPSETLLATVSSVGSYTAGQRWRVRLQVVGSTIRAKVWNETASEPADWQLTATDSDLTSPGTIGVRTYTSSSNTNTIPVVIEFDDVTIDQQLATVVRAINGIAKSHPAGQDVRLATPNYAAL